jgi:hypothetical protein
MVREILKSDGPSSLVAYSETEEEVERRNKEDAAQVERAREVAHSLSSR